MMNEYEFRSMFERIQMVDTFKIVTRPSRFEAMFNIFGEYINQLGYQYKIHPRQEGRWINSVFIRPLEVNDESIVPSGDIFPMGENTIRIGTESSYVEFYFNEKDMTVHATAQRLHDDQDLAYLCRGASAVGRAIGQGFMPQYVEPENYRWRDRVEGDGYESVAIINGRVEDGDYEE